MIKVLAMFSKILYLPYDHEQSKSSCLTMGLPRLGNLVIARNGPCLCEFVHLIIVTLFPGC